MNACAGPFGSFARDGPIDQRKIKNKIQIQTKKKLSRMLSSVRQLNNRHIMRF